jgi:hypothetical protein
MLLSSVIRGATVTGDASYINGWLAPRQGGRWAQQTVQNVVPAARPRTRAEKDLDDLRARGLVTKDEYETLRRRVR